ncbi:MAG: hypothetical protein ACRECP_12625, partial [Methylocella sp.]
MIPFDGETLQRKCAASLGLANESRQGLTILVRKTLTFARQQDSSTKPKPADNNNMAVTLDGPRIAAMSAPPEQLVVFLHGYGANGNDL